MSDSIFQSPQAKNKLEHWYERFLERVPAPVEHRAVDTSHGAGHVLLAGNPSNPPLVCLHGSLASSAHLVSELKLLLESRYLIAPDLPGQSVKGPPVRLSMRGDALAQWLTEVLDGLDLGLGEVDLLAVSWGGFVGAQMAAVYPQRVRRLVLLVPAGIVMGSPLAGLTHFIIPLTRYRKSPTETNLRRFVEPIFTTMDDDWMHYMGDALRGFVLDMRPPPLARNGALQAFRKPALVVAADGDISFPGVKLLARAKKLLPQAETELLKDCRHSPPTTDEFRGWLAARIEKFLA